MGHGSPKGLFGINFNRSYVIDEDTVDSLQYKKCIFIWCHADQFVKEHNLKGFHSGMFISEVGEIGYTEQRAIFEQIFIKYGYDIKHFGPDGLYCYKQI